MAGRAGSVQTREEMPKGDLINLYNTWRESAKKVEPGSFQWCLVAASETISITWNIAGSVRTSETLFFLWGWLNTGGLEKFAQRGCGTSILADTEKPPGHGSEQSVVGDLTWARSRTKWPPNILYNLNHFVILWIAESVCNHLFDNESPFLFFLTLLALDEMLLWLYSYV